MELSLREKVRTLIQDQPRAEQIVLQGDGRSPVFILRHDNITDLEVSLLGSDSVAQMLILDTVVGTFEGQSNTVDATEWRSYEAIEFVFDVSVMNHPVRVVGIIPVRMLDQIADGELASYETTIGTIGVLTITGVTGDDITFTVRDTELTAGNERCEVYGLVDQFIDDEDNVWIDYTNSVTFDAEVGKATLSGAIKGSVRFIYQHTAFSDAELDYYLELGGNDPIETALFVLRYPLSFDAVKRSSWRAPDGTAVDDTAAMAHIASMIAALERQQKSAAATMGAFGNWGENQGGWYG